MVFHWAVMHEKQAHTGPCQIPKRQQQPPSNPLSHTHTHPLHKTLTSLSASKQASIEQVGSVIRDAEQKKKGIKKVSVFMRLQFMTLLGMVLDMAVLFVCLFVFFCGSFLWA